MADFDQLAPEIRCVELVGQFLQAWSVMEGSLHKAIGAALEIEEIKLHILCAHIQFRGKISILRTLIDTSTLKDEKDELQSSLKDLADCAGKRNMMAHNQFQPDDFEKGC